MMLFEIEKGVPMPADQKGKKGSSKYPLADMSIGDSFFVPNGRITTVRKAAYQRGPALNRRFSVRTVDGGVRVWRVE